MVKKKYISILILVMLFCVACTSKNNDEEVSSKLKVKYDYQFDDLNIKDSGEGIHKGDIIYDENIAIEYSDMIFENVLKKEKEKYKEKEISYDSEKGVWVVTYMLDKKTLGEDVNIAIKKSTGEILLIWAGE